MGASPQQQLYSLDEWLAINKHLIWTHAGPPQEVHRRWTVTHVLDVDLDRSWATAPVIEFGWMLTQVSENGVPTCIDPQQQT